MEEFINIKDKPLDKPMLLIDGDILVYSIAYSVETPIYVVGGGVYARKGYAERIAKETGKTIKKRVNIGHEGELRKKLKAKLKVICSDIYGGDYDSSFCKIFITASKISGNFRSKIATLLPYKGNRADTTKPFHYRNLRRILIDEFKAMLVRGQEADDQIAIEQQKFRDISSTWETSVIVTNDKDLYCVPGWHYNIGRRELIYVDEDTSIKNFFRQLLIGDATDNIPGIARLLKRDNKIKDYNKLVYHGYIKEFDEFLASNDINTCYRKVRDMYFEYGYGYKEIIEIGSLLWLRRRPEQNWWDVIDNEELFKGVTDNAI